MTPCGRWHLGVCNGSFCNGIFHPCQLKSLKFFFPTVPWGGLNQRVPLRIFGETIVSKYLRVCSVNRRACNSCQPSTAHPGPSPKARIMAYLYPPLTYMPQTATPLLEWNWSHDLSPLYSTVCVGSCGESTSPKYVGSDKKSVKQRRYTKIL